jgi:hypothetical protein
MVGSYVPFCYWVVYRQLCAFLVGVSVRQLCGFLVDGGRQLCAFLVEGWLYTFMCLSGGVWCKTVMCLSGRVLVVGSYMCF